MGDEFVFPEVHVGDPVKVWADPSLGTCSLGQVVRVMGDAVDAYCLDRRGGKLRLSCLHKDDPQIPRLVDRFKDNDSGIFDLADSVKRTRALESRLSGLEKAVEELAAEIARANKTASKR